jgi:hypothetical protein
VIEAAARAYLRALTTLSRLEDAPQATTVDLAPAP